MQLCQIHFYQKIARKKVARVNAALYTAKTVFYQILFKTETNRQQNII